MKKLFLFSALLLSTMFFAFSQSPKLVVGIVIDQMRWDNIYRYQNGYQKNGFFKTVLQQGFSCENTYISHIPTITACGHATIYTGATPAIHGIIANEWYDRKMKKIKTSVSDTLYERSPRNMWATTIGDQLKLSNIGKSRTFSVALKDRGAILPGGHACNAAFWWDEKKGNWTTSSYYKNIPAWTQQESAKSMVDSLYQFGWKPLYPLSAYINSSADKQQFENDLIDKDATTFNYDLQNKINKDYRAVFNTPIGLAVTVDFAKKIITKEKLGFNPAGVTDMLTVSFSAPDIIGHAYGPQSVEMEDTYLRLDAYLADLVAFLDSSIGRINYVLFLTADHGVSPIPEFLQDSNLHIPSGRHKEKNQTQLLNQLLQKQFLTDSLVIGVMNAQVYFNEEKIINKKLSREQVVQSVLSYFQQQDNVLYVFECVEYAKYPMPIEIKEQFAKGYNVKNSGTIAMIYKPFFIDTYVDGKGTTHGAWNSYDAHIPLLWLGGKIKNGKTYQKYKMTDIAPTVAAMLNIEAPSCSIGNVIQEVME